jgi:hypothetical protein
MRSFRSRLNQLRAAAEAGGATVEYALLMLTVVAFAGALYKVVTSAKVQAALSGIIEKALH